MALRRLPLAARAHRPNGSGATTIWLARHGEVHNPRGLLYGRLPRMGLSLEGERQARALAELLASRPLEAIYTSPLLRARKTAEAIQRCHPGLRVRTDSDLIEVKTGWDGRPMEELNAIGWDFFANRLAPSDDTLETIRDRTRRWRQRVLRRHAGGEIVGVTHGDPILVTLADLRGLPLELDAIRPTPYLPTACVFRLRFRPDGTFRDSRFFVPHGREGRPLGQAPGAARAPARAPDPP